MWPMMLAGAGLGFGKMLEDRHQRYLDGQIRAAEEQWSPYTHQGPTTQVGPNGTIGSIMQGAVAGGQFGQGVDYHQRNPDARPVPLATGFSPFVTGPAAQQSGANPAAGPVAYNPYAWAGI